MPIKLFEAKLRLDTIINKARVDLYKPIQIAEVLRRSRLENDIDLSDKSTYQNESLRWRNVVTLRLLGKVSTSSARYQHDIWNPTAMPPEILEVLDAENRRTAGAVERYIYMRFADRQGTVAKIIASLESALPSSFNLADLFTLFVTDAGIRRSVDKAYEIVAHSLFETVVTSLDTVVRVSVPSEREDLLAEFSDMACVLLGLEEGETTREERAHLYRVGVTNAADRGLDMWANFGPAIQVKHLTLDQHLANDIVDQVESENVVIVCRDADAETIKVITRQIGWGRRVRGIVTESDLISWYDRCLRGKFAVEIASPLLNCLVAGFKAEFPQHSALPDFLAERGYHKLLVETDWLTETERALKLDN